MIFHLNKIKWRKLMKLKKVLCGVTAAITLGSFSIMPVSAADAGTQEVKKLLTVDFNSIEGAQSLDYLGDGYFIYDTDTDIKGINGGMIRTDVNKWRETGEFISESVESDFGMTGLIYLNTDISATRGNIVFQNDDNDFLVKLDKDKNALTKVGTYGKPSFVRGLKNGYIITGTTGQNFDYTLISPDGKESTGSFTYDGDDWMWNMYFSTDFDDTNERKYVFYVNRKIGNSAFDDGYEGEDFEVYGVKPDGTHDTLYSVKTAEGMWYGAAYSNASSWVDQVRPYAPVGHVYSEEEDQIYTFDGKFYVDVCDNGSDVTQVPFERICSKLYGKKTVGYFSRYSDGGELQASAYVLFSVDGGDGYYKVLSKSYKHMSTHDGEIYLVKNADDKWGYIDSNGNELAFFDDAGSFIDDYAPVVLNGKGYLIDRNMNKVTEDIAATGTSTFDDGLYGFNAGDNVMLVTYSNETAAVSVEKTSEPTSSETSSESADTNSTAPSDSNPSSGVAMSVLPIIAAISAVIVIKSKK